MFPVVRPLPLWHAFKAGSTLSGTFCITVFIYKKQYKYQSSKNITVTNCTQNSIQHIFVRLTAYVEEIIGDHQYRFEEVNQLLQ
jgi:hypothetical protein